MAEKAVLQELRKAASVDSLTELLNRRFIETKLLASIEELKRYGTAFGVIFGDIDRFKELNDTYDHIAGDAVLQMVAGTLSENFRGYDLAARWGVDEFFLLLGILPVKLCLRLSTN